jgi:hypothetical protein
MPQVFLNVYSGDGSQAIPGDSQIYSISGIEARSEKAILRRNRSRLRHQKHERKVLLILAQLNAQ